MQNRLLQMRRGDKRMLQCHEATPLFDGKLWTRIRGAFGEDQKAEWLLQFMTIFDYHLSRHTHVRSSPSW